MSDFISVLGLRVESSQAVRDLDTFEKRTKALGLTAKSAAASVAGLFATSKSAQFARSWLQAAADTQEVAGKFSAVFKHMSADAQKAADSLVASFNYSEAQAREKLSTMADIFKKAGLSLADSLRYATDLNKQAADLEAFTNAAGGLEQTTNALTKAMLGETESAKTLGVVVLESTVKAKMAEEARRGLTFATKQAALMHARYSVIMEQSASATGQVSRESDNYSSRLRVLRARAEDLKGALGEALIEPATKIVTVAAAAAEKVAALDSTTRGLIVVGGLATTALVSLGAAVSPLITAFASLSMAKRATAGSTAKEAAASAVSTTASTAATAAITAETRARAALASTLDLETAAILRNNAARSGGTFPFPAKGGKTSGGGASQPSGGGAALTALTFAPLEKIRALFGKLLGVLGKLPGPLGKIFAPLARFGNSAKAAGDVAEKAVGPLGRLVSRLASFARPLGRVASVSGRLGPVAAAIAAAGTAVLAVFQDAGGKLEIFLNETWPKVKENIGNLGTVFVESIKSIPGKIKSTLGGVVDWTANGLLGAGQFFKRLAGFETEASRAYALNKKLEAANKARAVLQEAEKACLEAEKKILLEQAAVRQELASRRAGRAFERADEWQKEGDARAKLAATVKEIEEKQAELNAKLAELTGNGTASGDVASSLSPNERIEAAAQKQAAAERELGAIADAERKIDQNDALTKAEKAAQKEAVKARRQELLKQKSDAEKEREKAAEAANALTAEAETLKTELAGLAEKWGEQGKALDELTRTLNDSNTAFKEEQRRFEKNHKETARSSASAVIEQEVELAKTDADKRKALLGVVADKKALVADAEQAEKDATRYNDLVKTERAKLESAEVADALAELKKLSGTDDGSQETREKFESIRARLVSAGYANAAEARFEDGGAAGLYAAMTEQRDKDARKLDLYKSRRDEAQEKADGLGAARGALATARNNARTFEDERTDARIERLRAERKRERDGDKIDEDLARTVRNDWYNRALRGSSDYGKMALLQEKGAFEQAEAENKMRGQVAQIRALDDKIKELDKLDDTGTMTAAQRKERDRLREDRDRLQGEFNETRTSELQNRIANENERYSVAQSIASEQMETYKKRLLEQREAEKDARGPVDGIKATAAGSSEAFKVASRVWDTGQKTREKTVENIEKYVERMQKNFAEFLTRQASPTVLQMEY